MKKNKLVLLFAMTLGIRHPALADEYDLKCIHKPRPSNTAMCKCEKDKLNIGSSKQICTWEEPVSLQLSSGNTIPLQSPTPIPSQTNPVPGSWNLFPKSYNKESDSQKIDDDLLKIQIPQLGKGIPVGNGNDLSKQKLNGFPQKK